AQIAGKADANLLERWTPAERGGGHDHAGRTDAALRAAVLDERAWQPMAPTKPFDRRHTRAVDVRSRHQARVHRRAVHEHRTRAALTFAAAFLRPRQPAVLTKHIEQAFQRVNAEPHTLRVQHE